MENVTLDTLIQNIGKVILSSNNKESDQIFNEFKYSYYNYLDLLQIDYPSEKAEFNTNTKEGFIREKIHPFKGFGKYIEVDKESFCLLITVYEMFILPNEMINKISEISKDEKKLKDIFFDDESKIKLTNKEFFDSKQFLELGKLLFNDRFDINDFISKKY